jgi:hypothetical protein
VNLQPIQPVGIVIAVADENLITDGGQLLARRLKQVAAVELA